MIICLVRLFTKLNVLAVISISIHNSQSCYVGKDNRTYRNRLCCLQLINAMIETEFRLAFAGLINQLLPPFLKMYIQIVECFDSQVKANLFFFASSPVCLLLLLLLINRKTLLCKCR